jgi:phage-related protein
MYRMWYKTQKTPEDELALARKRRKELES